MKDLEHLLREHPFASGLPSAALSLLVGCASNVQYEPGEYLFRTGEPADRFFILRHGEVAVEVYAAGRGRITIETAGEGDVLGWSWLVPPHRWLFDGRAITLTRAIALDGACLRAKCEANHDLGYELLKRVTHVMAERLTSARLQVLDLYGDGSGDVV
ncbi:MAG: cyclic nucleotide-binding domain-containing protein [Deltaproteobacteria bacterium]|nr:cyclic nucleotide-binding domain-containing protein [Deltaproteobacteria bacterium]